MEGGSGPWIDDAIVGIRGGWCPGLRATGGGGQRARWMAAIEKVQRFLIAEDVWGGSVGGVD